MRPPSGGVANGAMSNVRLAADARVLDGYKNTSLAIFYL
jgi:hypothetical protein